MDNIKRNAVYEVEETPHKKTKNSDISKSAKKSNHKHIYKDVLVKSYNSIYGEVTPHYGLGKQCKICGRIVQTHYFLTKKCAGSSSRVIMTQSEILAAYANLEVVDEK